MAETVERPVDRRVPERSANALLRIVFPRKLAAHVELAAEKRVVGRRPEAKRGIRVNDPTVSRRHFVVEWDAKLGLHFGHDLGSRNGSRVDGAEIQDDRVPLDDNSVIRLGDVLIVYERSSALAVADPPEVSKEAIFGDAAATRQLRAAVARAAPDPSPVLLIGETGTGKEYVTREVHRLSNREGPMLAINCAALSPQLIESQLFGHVRGAFTGAQTAHEGLFRAADGGSLLLDEIGELPRELQPKLLRVLQERDVLPVGEKRPVKVDVRVVAATLRDLGELARDDKFRLDLYARLSMWEVRVPALRERRADVLCWVDRLVEKWHEERSVPIEALPEFDAEAAETLLLSDWPDNLRGLDRLVHRICSEPPPFPIGPTTIDGYISRSDITGKGGYATGGAAGPAAATGSGTGIDGDSSDDDTIDGLAVQKNAANRQRRRRARPPKPSQEELARILEENEGSVRATAKHYGRDRRQIYRWMEQYGLRDKES